eukprot:2716223-Amphidinium_carterae.1
MLPELLGWSKSRIPEVLCPIVTSLDLGGCGGLYMLTWHLEEQPASMLEATRIQQPWGMHAA